MVTLFASALTHGAVVNLDVIGVGAAAYDIAKGQNLNVQALNVAEKSDAKDKSGKLSFTNKRAEYCWRLRELLDPDSGENLALPNDPELLADLCALRWKMQPNGIRIESKDEMRARLGRSPDSGDALMLALVAKKETGGFIYYAVRRPEELRGEHWRDSFEEDRFNTLDQSFLWLGGIR